MSEVGARVKDLVDSARSETGLDDFGGDSWREGLEVLVRSALEEGCFNEYGEGRFYGAIQHALSNRLQIEDWHGRHPEIADEVVEVELLGVGFPRTGSTALAYLLAEDRSVRSLRTWEAPTPCPPPGLSDEADQARIAAAEASVEAMDQVAPRMRSMLPQSATGPTEDHDLMSLELTSQVFLSMGRLPAYAEWLLSRPADHMERVYRYERRVLQLLQWRSGPKRWQLKSPTHTLFLDGFERVFPEARYVMTHRDPSRVLVSVSDVYYTLGAPANDGLDPAEVGELNLMQWGIALDRCMAFRDAGREHKFHDVAFSAFQSDPIAEIRGLYSWLGRELTAETEQRMRDWWATNRRTTTPERPDPGLFGFSDESMAKEFPTYRQRFADLL
jgi:hypothetical protein